jgi:glycine/D-amino acid oxidase-like deaminating enzyme
MNNLNNSDVLIVGGGVIGVFTALACADAGLRVALVEGHDKMFRGTSSAGFGSLTPYSDPFFVGTARAVATEGVRLYREQFHPALDRLVDGGIELRDEGLIELLDDEVGIQNATDLIASLEADGYGSATRWLSHDEVAELEPNLAPDFRAAVWLDEPSIDTSSLFPALEVALHRHPMVSVHLGARIERADARGEGWRATSAEATYEADRIVVASGATTRGIDGLPTAKLVWARGDALELRTPDARPVLQRHVYRSPAFVTPRSKGRLLLGATYVDEDLPDDSQRTGDRVVVAQLQKLLEMNASILPDIARYDFVRSWRGWRPATPDGFPIVGPISGDQNLVYATGAKGLGVTMAPAIAAIVAEGIGSGTWESLPAEFSAARPGAVAGGHRPVTLLHASGLGTRERSD